MRRLSLALLLPLLANACVLTVNDPNDVTGTGGDSTGGGGSSSDSTAAGTTSGTSGDPVTTTADPSLPTSSDATSSTTNATTQTSQTTADPSTTTTDPSTTTGNADPDEAATQLCVDTINMYRATLGLPALARWKDAEDCSDTECLSDGMTGTPHGAFGMCGEFAQNECPGWPGDGASFITDCLQLMWDEGPGADFNTHGHYINMSNPDYTMVACGFAPGMGGTWAVQNFK
jgi:hypothetical protein